MIRKGFNIDYIMIFPETALRLRKNLKVNYAYRFKDVLCTDFFARNISVHAIVGKNGSGKSTLLEILYRLINNLSYVLLKDIPRNASDNPIYVFGLYAEIGWHEDNKVGVLRCRDCRLDFNCGDVKESFEVETRASKCIFTQEYNYSNEYALMKSVAENFFYTLVMNYSMQSYVATDYLGEECKTKSSNRHKSFRVSDVWINSLFHKNDGYMCPININPYRDNGVINMNTEMRLTRSRVAALLQYFKFRGEHLIDGYQLWDVVYTYNPYIINEYFDPKWLLSQYNKVFPTDSDKEKENREKSYENDTFRLKMAVDLFKKTLDSEYDNVSKTLLAAFNIDTTNRETQYVVGMLYLVCKILNIGKKYPKYILLTNKYERYEVSIALELQSKQPRLDLVKEIVSKIDEDWDKGSHVTLKVVRALNFLGDYERVKNLNHYGVVEDDIQSIRASEYLTDTCGDAASRYSLEELEYSVLPSIFKQEVYLQKELEDGNLSSERIELCQLSSGERQFVFSVSSIIYHLTNLRTVKKDLPNYHCFNLVIDEAEICFHPEYQRTFLTRLLTLLDRLEFNCGPYINIILTTHSPFLLSDIPDSHILYMTENEKAPESRTFGANIYDLLNQQFFMSNTIGEFAAEKIGDLVRLYRMDVKSQERERLFRENHKKLLLISEFVGDDYLRKVVVRMIVGMCEQYGLDVPLTDKEIDRQIQEHEDAILELKRKKGQRYD